MAETISHIAILCSRLDLPGGIERAVVNTANLFAQKGHKVTLVVLDETAQSFYPVNPRVETIRLSLSFGITRQGNIISRKIRLLSDVLQLKKMVKRINPDLIIATEYPFAAAAILCGAKKKATVVSWEHHHFYELEKNSFWKKLSRLTYPRLDAVICLNEDEQTLFHDLNSKTVVIPNFTIPYPSEPAVKNNCLLTVGRLTAVKGTDLLLATAKQVLSKHPDWQWKLIGDGDLKEQVTSFIEKEKLGGRLLLQLPVDHQIRPEYQQASLYVMTSRNECFPMTLLEAMSAGLPCIAFDCETGPRHIIAPDQTGLLVEKNNPEKMTEAVSQLINDAERRKKMGEKALQHVQQFSPDKVYQLWKQVISNKGGME